MSSSERSHWTAADIPDQSGRVALVTGANSGLGLQVTLRLAERGARVVMACRDRARGGAAEQRVRQEHPRAHLELRSLDLADLSSVRSFAAGWTGPLDLLVNNAGVMATPRRSSVDGFELQLATNHLGHFALTGLLAPVFADRTGARVVTVSSSVHRQGRIDFGDLQSERRYRRWAAYAQSKMANLLFALELDRRLSAGHPAISVAAHPGYAATNLQAAGPRMSGSRVGQLLADAGNRVFAQSDEEGALPLLFAATDPSVRGGDYVGPTGWLELRGAPGLVSPARTALDRATAERLWQVSEELTGVRFTL